MHPGASMIAASGHLAQRFPPLRGGSDVGLRVGRGLVPPLLVVVEVEPAVDDDPGPGGNRDQAAVRHATGAEAAELWGVAVRLCGEEGLVLGAGEPPPRILPDVLEVGTTFDR